MKRKRVSDENTFAEGLIDLEVLCLNGEGLTFKIRQTTLGREVHRMVSEQLPCKRGAKLALHHKESRLNPHQTLGEQGINGAATVSCTWIPTNLYNACCYARGLENADESELQGVTQLEFAPDGEYCYNLPGTLQKLKFILWNQSMERITLPDSLQNLTFDDVDDGVNGFSQSMDRVTFPSAL